MIQRCSGRGQTQVDQKVGKVLTIFKLVQKPFQLNMPAAMQTVTEEGQSIKPQLNEC
jgi:hypothetical protein